MRIEFDTGNAVELLAVATLIEVLRGDMPATLADQGPRPTPPAPPVADEPQPDPATAFGGVSPEQAFAPPAAPVVSPAPPAPPVAATPAAPPPGADVDKHGLPWDKRIHATPASKKKDGEWRAKRNLDDATKAAVEAELRQVMGAPAPLAASGGAAAAPAPVAAASTTAPPAPPPTPAAAGTASGPEGAAPASDTPPAPPVPTAPPAPPAPPHDPLAAAVADGWAPHPTDPAYYWRGSEVALIADTAARYPAPTGNAPPAPPAAPVAATPPASAAPSPAAPSSAPAASFADLMRKITGMQTAGTLTVERTTEISQSLGITGVRDLMHRPDLIPAFDAALPVVG